MSVLRKVLRSRGIGHRIEPGIARSTGRRARHRIGSVALAAGALALTAGAHAVDIAPEVGTGLPALTSGAEIYAHVCAACHMPNGTGAVGAGRIPALAGDKALASWEYVALTVLNGRHLMPPFGSELNMGPLHLGLHLTDAQVADVVNYVRTHLGNHWHSHVRAAQVSALPHPAAPDPPASKSAQETKR